jgi:polyether ionophore transport system permease protein
MSAANGTVAASNVPRSNTGAVRLAASRALARRAFTDARVRTISFGYLFAVIAYIQPVGYRGAYPTPSSRLAFAHSFADNKAIRLFYGVPHDLLTVSGYTAWRVGGTLAIFAAVFGMLAAVRALRTEEDTGRMELVLSGSIGRGAAFLSAMVALAAGVLILGLAEFAGLVAAGLPAGGSADLALATASVVPVFVGVGALTSQLASTRRMALELGGAAVGLFLALRVIVDTSASAGWLRWATPLGWAEEVRPFTGPQPIVLALPAAAAVALLALSARIAAARDIGTGVLPARERSEPRLGLLSSPIAQALRSERASLIVWISSIGAFAYITGVIAKSTSNAGISKSLQHEVSKLGTGSILTPTGYLAFVFIFFILAVSLFVCAQIGAARHEEADERLETLLSLPVSRRGWLGGRLLLAVGGAIAISLTAGLLIWAGAESGGVSVSLTGMLEAGANCLPIALMFLGIAALAYAIFPRAGAGLSYGLVTVAFLWDLFGSLLDVPKWLVEATPFVHVGLVPAQPFRAAAALVMLGTGLGSALAAMWVFGRRDLTGA